MSNGIVTFLLSGLFFATVAQAAPAQKRFDDWQVTCNNQNFCVARNAGKHQGLVMTLNRSAGAQTDASLRIDLGTLDNAADNMPPVATSMRLDDQPLSLLPDKWNITPHHLRTDDPETIVKFLQQIQKALAITLNEGGGIISLRGLKAALTFIDTVQQRVGSETAWVRKGAKAPLSVPPVPALQTVAVTSALPLSDEERNALLDYGNWRMNNGHCSLAPERREVRVAALSNDKALLLISCEAGAYNTVDLAWLVSRQKPLASRQIYLRLPFTPGNGSQDMELMNASFSEESKSLITLSKGRSIGDCGVSTRWRFDGQRFRLVRYAAEPTCDNWHSADAWPTLWVTQ